MLYLSLPHYGNFGWGVCSKELTAALARKTPVQPPPNNGNPTFVTDYPMLHSVQCSNLMPMTINNWSSSRNVGLAFIEDIGKAALHVNMGKRYFDHIIAGSTWCANKLSEIGLPSVSSFIQGVDTSVFQPIEESTVKDHFYILSAGKAEYRKGTDLIIAAFRNLSQRYDDMHLLCSWGSTWPHTVDSLAQSKHIYFPLLDNATSVQKMNCAMTINTIPSDRYTMLDMVPHKAMAAIFHSADIAVFPSRCEAGTNLPLMEAMACGIPVIASLATGHADVVAPEHTYSITSGVCGENEWFESDISEIESKIEYAYHHRAEIKETGLLGSEFVKQFTWDKAADTVLSACTINNNTQTFKTF